MNKKNLYITNLIITSAICIVLFATSCSDNPPSPPAPDPTFFCNFSGDYTFEYKAPSRIFYNSMTDKLQLMVSTFMTYESQNYDVVLSVYFADKLEKTGTFPFFRTHYKKNFDCAIAAIGIGCGNPYINTYYSDSGSVTITSITGNSVKGTFEVFLSDSSGKGKIILKNGKIDM